MQMIAILERIQPYDKVTSKQHFIRAITPELIKSFDEQVLLEKNQEWVEKAQEKVFFIVNDDRWKRKIRGRELKPKIRLSFVGPEKAATVSIDYQ